MAARDSSTARCPTCGCGNTVRDAAEIADNLDGFVDGGAPGLVANWRLDDSGFGPAATALDATGNGADGVITGDPQYVTAAPRIFAPSVETFVEDGPPVAIDSGLVVRDVDSADLVGATVSITGGFVAAEDVLEFTPRAGIASTYDSVTGVLTLTGTATVADYQAALRSVTYANTNTDDPVTARPYHHLPGRRRRRRQQHLDLPHRHRRREGGAGTRRSPLTTP